MEAVEIEHEHDFPQDSSRVVSGSEAFTRMEIVRIKLDVKAEAEEEAFNMVILESSADVK